MYNAAVASPIKQQRRAAVLAAFTGTVPALRTPPVYRLGLLVVALAMVLLPLGYVGLVGLVAYGVLLNGTDSLVVLGVGSTLVLFMIKPLFAPGPQQFSPRQLRREEQPLLYDFVERLARTVGAPVPRAIGVTCDVNAAANFRRGVWSMMRGDLVLIIGLPLVAGLELRQLAGVLAHELGHFSQRTGMGLTYIINRVNVWFTRVVYERDAWDERLVRWSQRAGIIMGVPLYLARLCVWLTRKVLWVPMALGHLLSMFLLRQMEYDADRYQIHLSGSEAFVSTARRVEYLSASMAMTGADLYEFWSERRLPDSYPTLVAANEQQIPSVVQALLDEEMAETHTSMLETHPSTGARMARATASARAGCFQYEGPAADLFDDFHGLCTEVSLAYYNEALDEEVAASDLHPVEELLQRQKRRSEEFETLRRYFQDTVSTLRPMWFEDEPPSWSSVEEAAAEVVAAREQLTGAAEAYGVRLRRAVELDARVVELGQAAVLLAARFKLAREDYDLPEATPVAVQRARDLARQQLAELGQPMEPLERAARRRLQAVLWLLDQEGIARKMDDAPSSRDEVRRLAPVVRVLSRVLPRMEPLGQAVEGMVTLLNNLEGNEEDEDLHEELYQQLQLARSHLLELESVLDATLYPFSHGSGTITVHRHLVPAIPAEEDLAAHVDVCGQAEDRAQSLYVAVMGRLAAVAEEIERAMDLPPLPDPPPWEEEEETGHEEQGTGRAGLGVF